MESEASGADQKGRRKMQVISERGGCVSAADRGGRGSVKNQDVGRLRKLTLMMKVMNM